MPHPCFNKNISEVDLDVLVKMMKVGDYAPVSGGFSSARRGIVRLPDGRSFFAKQATCEHTARWLEKEAAIYTAHDLKYPLN